MVGVVNSHFGRALRAMGCAGEVSLFCGCEAGFDACNAFDKYAVHIRVRFRCGVSLLLEQGSFRSGLIRGLQLYVSSRGAAICHICATLEYLSSAILYV